jgi:hypothetical protein
VPRTADQQIRDHQQGAGPISSTLVLSVRSATTAASSTHPRDPRPPPSSRTRAA